MTTYQVASYNIEVSLHLIEILYAVGPRFNAAPVLAGAAYVFIPKLLSYWHPLSGDAGLVFPILALIALGLPGGFLGWLFSRSAHPRSDSIGRPRAPYADRIGRASAFAGWSRADSAATASSNNGHRAAATSAPAQH